jgi:hypothetical protein
MKIFGIAQALKMVTQKQSKKKCFFFLRGGLGNQLFQIYSLREKAIEKDFDVVFCDLDVRLNPRDGGGALGLNLMYSESEPHTQFMQVSRFIEYVLRFYRSRRVSFLRMPIVNLDHTMDLPANRYFIANGFLQEDLSFLCKVNFQPPMNLSDFIKLDETRARVALHIRATDSFVKSEMALTCTYYKNALRSLPIADKSHIDVYSDDTHFARSVCEKVGSYTFNYVEEHAALTSLELLANMSSYDLIVCSKSTLAWWAAIFAQRMRPDISVVSPWKNHFHQENWISVSVQ